MILKRFILTSVFAGLLCSVSLGEDWKEHKGQHFIIYYKNAPMDFIKAVEESAEEYYSEISYNLGFTRYRGWTWDERAKIYIYDDDEDYLNFANAYKWSHGIASVREKTIRTFPTAHGFFDSTLPHEMGHIIFREFIGYNAQLPFWVDEGVAMYQEKAKRWGAESEVKKAIKNGNFLSLQQLSRLYLTSDTDRKIVNLAYAEAASIVYYMINGFGEQKFVNFCRKLQEGGTLEAALESAYYRFQNIDELNKAWVNHLTNE